MYHLFSTTILNSSFEKTVNLFLQKILKVFMETSELLECFWKWWNDETSLDFNYVKPRLDSIKLKLQPQSSWLGVLMIYVIMTTWHGLLWLCLRQHPSEASVKISSESDLFWLVFREDFRVCLLCESFIKIWFVLDGLEKI